MLGRQVVSRVWQLWLENTECQFLPFPQARSRCQGPWPRQSVVLEGNGLWGFEHSSESEKGPAALGLEPTELEEGLAPSCLPNPLRVAPSYTWAFVLVSSPLTGRWVPALMLNSDVLTCGASGALVLDHPGPSSKVQDLAPQLPGLFPARSCTGWPPLKTAALLKPLP